MRGFPTSTTGDTEESYARLTAAGLPRLVLCKLGLKMYELNCILEEAAELIFTQAIYF